MHLAKYENDPELVGAVRAFLELGQLGIGWFTRTMRHSAHAKDARKRCSSSPCGNRFVEGFPDASEMHMASQPINGVC